MRITTDNRHARQSGSELGAHDMHNTLSHVVHSELANTKLFTVLVERSHLNTRGFIHYPFNTGSALGAVGGDIVIGCCDIGINAPGLAACYTQPLKCLGRCHLMNHMAIDINQCRAIIPLFNEMGIP